MEIIITFDLCSSCHCLIDQTGNCFIQIFTCYLNNRICSCFSLFIKKQKKMYELQPVFECVISFICALVRYFTAFSLFKGDKYYFAVSIMCGTMRIILALFSLYQFCF